MCEVVHHVDLHVEREFENSLSAGRRLLFHDTERGTRANTRVPTTTERRLLVKTPRHVTTCQSAAQVANEESLRRSWKLIEF